ncbi:MAG: putative lipid II flippase FtsW [Thermodesulfobacteriota bacterium]
MQNKTAPKKDLPLPDYYLLGAVLLMMALGMLMVMSSSAIMAERLYGDHYYFFKKQGVYTLFGLFAMYFGYKMPVKFFYKTVYLWLLAALMLLLLTLSPLGIEAGGASRWLGFGVATFQPLEFAKVALVLYLAYFFSHKQDMVKTFSVGFLPPLLVTGTIALVLMLQPDFGGAVFLTAVLFFMSLVGGTRLVYLLSSAILCAGAGALMIMESSYRLQRWMAFLEPFEHAKDVGYQVVQSFYGLGAGGVFGKGLGAGKQKLFYLPEAHTDFILAVLGEEMGFVGVSLVLFCLVVIVFRCFKNAFERFELQDRFTILGLALNIVLGGVLNIAVALGAVPPKGQPMPFISYGGSNMIMMSLSVGLILNIAGSENVKSGPVVYRLNKN